MISPARIPGPVSPSAAAALAGRWRRAWFLLLLNGVLGALLVVALGVVLVVWGAQARGGYSWWMWLGPLLSALCGLLVLPSRKELLTPDEWGGHIAAVFFLQYLVGMPLSHLVASPVIPADWFVYVGALIGVPYVLSRGAALAGRRFSTPYVPELAETPFRLVFPLRGKGSTLTVEAERLSWRLMVPEMGVPPERKGELALQDVEAVGVVYVGRRTARPVALDGLPERMVIGPALMLRAGDDTVALPTDDAELLADLLRRRTALVVGRAPRPWHPELDPSAPETPAPTSPGAGDGESTPSVSPAGEVTFDLARDGDRRVEVLYPETADRFLPTRLPGPVSFAAARHLAPGWRAAQPLLVLAMVVVPWFWVAFTVLIAVIATMGLGRFLPPLAVPPVLAVVIWWVAFGGARGRRLVLRPAEWGSRVLLVDILLTLFVLVPAGGWGSSDPGFSLGVTLGGGLVAFTVQGLLVRSARRRLDLDDPVVGGSRFVLRRRLRRGEVGAVELRSDQVAWEVPLRCRERAAAGVVPLAELVRVSYQPALPHEVEQPWAHRADGEALPLPEGMVLRLELADGRTQLLPVEDAPVLAAALAQRVLLLRSLSRSTIASR